MPMKTYKISRANLKKCNNEYSSTGKGASSVRKNFEVWQALIAAIRRLDLK